MSISEESQYIIDYLVQRVAARHEFDKDEEQEKVENFILEVKSLVVKIMAMLMTGPIAKTPHSQKAVDLLEEAALWVDKAVRTQEFFHKYNQAEKW